MRCNVPAGIAGLVVALVAAIPASIADPAAPDQNMVSLAAPIEPVPDCHSFPLILTAVNPGFSGVAGETHCGFALFVKGNPLGDVFYSIVGTEGTLQCYWPPNSSPQCSGAWIGVPARVSIHANTLGSEISAFSGLIG